MALIKAYKIVGNDLYFEEYLHWTFTPNQTEAVQVWQLKNVDKSELDTSKLEKVISFTDDADFETKKVNGRILLSIYSYFDQSECFFNCDEVTTSKRPYNNSELTEIILNKEDVCRNQSNEIHKHKQTLDEIEKFILREIDKKEKIREQVEDSTSTAGMKAKYQLDILNQFKLLLDNEK